MRDNLTPGFAMCHGVRCRMAKPRHQGAAPIVNFGGNVSFTPRHRYAPRSEREVLELLDRHAGGTIRVVASLHSWSDDIVCDDVVVDLRSEEHTSELQSPYV